MMRWHKVIVCVVVMMACIGWGWLGYQMFFRSVSETNGELLRFHVIASGDSVREQAVKLMVRDAVLDCLADDLEAAETMEEAKALVLAREDAIMAAARGALREAGEDKPVRMEVGRFSFPVRRYGDFIVPAGEYDAVRLVIGTGEGRNWWCVLFPPLCVVDAAVATSEGANGEKGIVYRSKLAELIGQ